jgi:hypothetical protein
MANSADTPNSNRSQFFFTFAAAEWLQGKHTIFGKVTGNTVYNLVKANEFETDDSDRPVCVRGCVRCMPDRIAAPSPRLSSAAAHLTRPQLAQSTLALHARMLGTCPS